MFRHGLYYIDLEQTKDLEEFMIDMSKLNDKKERLKHFKELDEQENSVPRKCMPRC
jgi:hypothetical protein